jgi:hypothetical protein
VGIDVFWKVGMKGGILLAVVISIVAVGCDRSERPATTVANAQPVVAASPVPDRTTWNLTSSDDKFCTYNRANLTTTLEKPTTGCSATITVGAAGIE